MCSSGRLAKGFQDGDNRPIVETNLQVNASRLASRFCDRQRPTAMIQSFEISSSGASRGYSVDKKLQACLTAHQARYSSEKKSSNSTAVDRDRFQNGSISDPSLLEKIDHDELLPNLSKDPAGQERPPAAAVEWEPNPYEGFRIGRNWREIQGERNWDGLLDPLDPILRSELIRYGEFAQATYDAFDYDLFSRFCGSCKFRKARFLKRSALENRGYEIEQYLYSTSEIHLPKFFKKSDVPDDEMWSKYSNWAGFVAVCTSPEEIARLGRRDIIVAWRGTVTNFEWMEDMNMSMCPTGVDPRRVGKGSQTNGSVDLKVEKGFLSLYKSRNKDSRFNKSSARDQVLGTLKRLLDRYEGEEMSITLTGHSLAGALATLCAYDIAESGVNVVRRPCPTSDNCSIEESKLKDPTKFEGSSLRNPSEARVPVTAYTFGAPRLGNSAFKDRVDELGVKVLRVVNVHDFVPLVPGLIFNEKLHMHFPRLKQWLLLKLIRDALDLLPRTYSHVGLELELDNLQSPFLRRSRYPLNTHNLEVYLHLLDGFQGKQSGGFNAKLYGGRDLALVNKTTCLLNPEHRCPPSWFQEENKGLVRIGGRFIYLPRDPEDFPEQPLHQEKFSLKFFTEPTSRPE